MTEYEQSQVARREIAEYINSYRSERKHSATSLRCNSRI
jgi:hypothetical protein